MNLRIVIGLAVSVCLQMLLGVFAAAVFPPMPSGVAPVTMAIQAGVIALLASIGGAFAARQPFMRAALVLWAVGWVSTVLVLKRIGGGQISVGDAAAANAMAIVVSGIATVLGVRIGRLLDRCMRGDAADATG